MESQLASPGCTQHQTSDHQQQGHSHVRPVLDEEEEADLQEGFYEDGPMGGGDEDSDEELQQGSEANGAHNEARENSQGS